VDIGAGRCAIENIIMVQSSAFFNASIYILIAEVVKKCNFFLQHIVNPTEFGGVLGRDVVWPF
jgi:hypothetical protein